MPINLAYLKSFLGSRGFESKIIDLNILYVNKIYAGDGDIKNKGKILNKIFNVLKNEISSFEPSVVAFSLLEPTFFNGIYLIKKIRSEFGEDIKIVVGGPHVSYLQKKVLDFRSIDVAITGEGELPLLELMQRIESGKNTSSQSYYTRKGDKIVGGNNPKYIRDLDSIPYPDYSDYEFKKYPFPFICSIFSRGCIKKCIFCGVPNIYSGYRHRSANNIFYEIKRNVDEYGFRVLAVTDSLLNANPILIKKTCKKIINENLDINWMGEVHPSLSDNLSKIMYTAGCRLLYIAPETGSQRIADIMGKDVDINVAEKSIVNAHNNGINLSSWYIAGLPNETSKDINKTFNFIEKTKDYVKEIWISPFGLSINTPVYKNPEKFGVSKISEVDYRLYCTYETKDPLCSFQNQMKLLLDLYKKYNLEAYNSKMMRLVRDISDNESVSLEEKYLLSESFQFPYKLYGVDFNEDYSYIKLFENCFKEVLTN